MNKVIIAQKAADEVVQMLQNVAEVALVKEGDLADLQSKLPGAVAVLAGTWMKFNADLMSLSPTLKVISRTGAGVDNVDVEEATRRGILVLNTPAANALSVAEHTLALILALSKQLAFLDASIRKGDFKARRLYLPMDVEGKTLGVIGCGPIGRLVAEKCRDALHMRTLGYDPYLQSAPQGLELRQSIPEILRESDFVSLHVPLTPQTRNLIGRDELAMMKPCAFLINCARGGIVDESALADALDNGVIAGAAIDVFEKEPPDPGSPLMTCKNLLMTPHSAALTKECVLRVALCAARGIVDYLSGKQPEFIVNRSVAFAGR